MAIPKFRVTPSLTQEGKEITHEESLVRLGERGTSLIGIGCSVGTLSAPLI